MNWILMGAGALAFIVDRLVKLWVLAALPFQVQVPVLPPWLYFTHIKNFGAAFGIFQHQRLMLTASGLLVLVAFWFLRKELTSSRWGRWGTCFLVAGDLGNLFDRIYYGGVIDFIDFRVWPVFNIADMFIDLGIALLVWHFFKAGQHSHAS